MTRAAFVHVAAVLVKRAHDAQQAMDCARTASRHVNRRLRYTLACSTHARHKQLDDKEFGTPYTRIAIWKKEDAEKYAFDATSSFSTSYQKW